MRRNGRAVQWNWQHGWGGQLLVQGPLISFSTDRCGQSGSEVEMPCLRRFVLFAVLATAVPGLQAQWLNYPTPGTPRTKDGKANLTAPAPRTAEGRPDLSGVWMHEVTSVAEMKRLYGAIID